MLWITLVLFVVGETVAETLPCPLLDTIENFNVARYMGKWYEAAKYSDSPEDGYECLTANYTLRGDGSFLMKNRWILTKTGEASGIDGIASPVHNFGDGKFTIRYLSTQVVVPEQYWVLATDYVKWAAVWRCTNSGQSTTRYVQILARKRNISDAVVGKAYEEVKKKKISGIPYVKKVRKNCPKTY